MKATCLFLWTSSDIFAGEPLCQYSVSLSLQIYEYYYAMWSIYLNHSNLEKINFSGEQ